MAKKKNELTVASLTSLATTATAVDLSAYATGDYLSRLQLINGQSKLVGKGLIDAGHFGIPSSDAVEDLGETVDILPLAVREKAMDLSGEVPIAVFDPASELYQDIVDRSAIKDSSCVYGPSFLVLERSTGRFLELFMGNKSGRFEADNMSAYLPISEDKAKEFGVEPRGPQPCTLTTEYIERPKHAWHVIKIGKCSTPFTELPDIDAIVKEVADFVTPEADVPEVAETSGRSR